MRSKYKRFIIAGVTLVVGLFVFAFAAGAAFGFGVGLAGGTSAGGLYWVGAAVIIAPLLYLFITELVEWTRNYDEADVQAVTSKDQTPTGGD